MSSNSSIYWYSKHGYHAQLLRVISSLIAVNIVSWILIAVNWYLIWMKGLIAHLEPRESVLFIPIDDESDDQYL